MVIRFIGIKSQSHSFLFRHIKMTQGTLECCDEAINCHSRLLCVLKKKNKFSFYCIICSSHHKAQMVELKPSLVR